MRVAHLAPGSGGTFYCENCLRDCVLVRALRREGHDAIMVPLYLPFLIDQAPVSGTEVASLRPATEDAPLFFGGIGAYLQQYIGLFRRTPRWVDRWFEAPWLLRLAARREGSTGAAQLGAMTLSMLNGRAGHQRKEFDRLVTWLAVEKPDVVHISNALLLGAAVEIKAAMDVRVVCSLQDEEPWVEAMEPAFSRSCWGAMARDARAVDMFTAPSQWYARRMQSRLNIPDARIRVVPLGIEIDDVAQAFLPAGIELDGPNPQAGMPAPRAAAPPGYPVIGYLSRLNEAQGFGVLIDAFIHLKKDPALKGLRLRATGGVTPADESFVGGIRERLRTLGFEGDVEILPEFDREKRRAFLRGLSVLSTPVPEGEAFGMFIIESLACGVPVVQPDAGAFPEVVGLTGGGVIYDPRVENGLAEALRPLLLEPERARRLGEQGRANVYARFTAAHMAMNMLNVYEQTLSAGKQ